MEVCITANIWTRVESTVTPFLLSDLTKWKVPWPEAEAKVEESEIAVSPMTAPSLPISRFIQSKDLQN